MARRIRVAVVRTVMHVRVGHVGGPLSAADILAALYGRILRIRPAEPDWPERDRFILSKGHSSLGQYAAMALAGYFPVDELATFDQKGSRLQGHPDMNRLPGIDISTGLAGHGPLGRPGLRAGRAPPRQGRAHLRAARRRRVPGGPGLGGRPRGRRAIDADNLIAIVDHNRFQQFGWRGESAPRTGCRPRTRATWRRAFAAFGWRVLEMDGNDMRRGRRDPRGGAPAGGPADRGHRPHAQGPRCLLHGGRLRAGTWACPPTRSSPSAMAELGEPRRVRR